jgi:MFS transporter, ACS family, tartrate transporter
MIGEENAKSEQIAQAVERATIAKVSWRLLPLIVVLYCVAYIDRTNISFASLTMNKDLGLTAFVYGLGAGIFFLSYFLFEIPSNLILEKTGARLWIARIMITWGLVSALTAFATGPASFLVFRFLLGAAEAGFFPGMILYFTYWYPSAYRGRVISALFIAQPVANALAAIVSGAILDNADGLLGLKGWQWVFVLEAVPAILFAFVVLVHLTDRPAVATWLAEDERTWLEGQLAEERRRIDNVHRLSLWQALGDSRVFALSMMYLTSVTANYGIVFFMPQIVKGMNLSNQMTGLLTAVPYVIGTVGLLAWGYSSDRFNERRWHLIAAALLTGAGLICAGLFGSSYWALAGMAAATTGIYGSRAAFWPMPSMFLTGTAAAAAIALINATGNLGGYVGPFVVGWIKDATRSFEAGLYFLAACAVACAVITFFATHASRPPDEARAEALRPAAK